MFGKIRTIAGTSLYITYTDFGALALMIFAPVVLSLIIGLAFGQDDNAIDLDTSRLVIINQDQTVQVSDGDSTPRDVNWGEQIFEFVLITDVPAELQALVDAELATDIDGAREVVENGDRDAVLIIPPTFTADVLDPDKQGVVELYYNPGNEVTATILITVIEQLVAQINTGQVAQDILVGNESNNGFLIEKGIALGQTAAIDIAANDVLTQLFQAGAPSLVTLNAVDIEGEEQSFDSLQYFAPSMAILFMTFAMAAGMRSILEENRDWTLQRLMTTPTPRWVYMLGKMLGTFVSGVVQMVLLLVITTLVAVALGRESNVWGTNYVGLALMIVAIVAAASGLGLLFTGISKSVRQADNLANSVIIIMAMIGGTFIPVESNALLNALSNVSLNKWGIDGFVTLAGDGTLTDVLTHVAVLLGMAGAFFSIAVFGFNRRADLGR